MNKTARFDGMIGPQNLLSLVHNTADFLLKELHGKKNLERMPHRLIELGQKPDGFIDILLQAEHFRPETPPSVADREDYFALCMASHHCTVATFVPTDVDSKIRGILWQQPCDKEIRRQRFNFCLQAMNWDITAISKRATQLSGVGPVSGHNGEMLGVLAGALGTFILAGDLDFAEKAADTIDYELQRELHEFHYALLQANREIDLLKISMSLLHNVGDLDQGISFWKNKPEYQDYKRRFGKLGHENTTPYHGAFVVAGALYKNILAAEGHRHYPLREVKVLRRSADLLLPLGPFFDDWGATIGTHPCLETPERAEILHALVTGCKKIKGQLGYYRAIAGMAQASGSQFGKIIDFMPASARSLIKESEFKKHMAISRESFESSMRKKARAILEGFRKHTLITNQDPAQFIA